MSPRAVLLFSLLALCCLGQFSISPLQNPAPANLTDSLALFRIFLGRGLAWSASLEPSPRQPAGKTQKEPAEQKKVVFIRYRIAPNAFANVVASFKKTMRQRGYEEGRNIVYVDVRTSTADRTSVPEALAAVAAHRDTADMFITCGWLSMYVRQELQDSGVPQLFVPVLRSVALKMLPSVTLPPGTNLSGLYLMYPPEKILRLTRLLLPRLQRYAYIYDSRIPADMVFKDEYEKLSPRQRHGIDVHLLDLRQGVPAVLNALREKRIEAYGGIVGAFQRRHELQASGLPVITSFTLDIEREEIANYVRGTTVLAGLFNSFAYCGQQAAEMTADIFAGRRTIEETVPRPAAQTAFVSLDAARRLGIHVPVAALEAVDLVIR